MQISEKSADQRSVCASAQEMALNPGQPQISGKSAHCWHINASIRYIFGNLRFSEGSRRFLRIGSGEAALLSVGVY